MATRPQPPPAKAAGDDPPAAAGRDDRTEQVLARSREIREKGRAQLQAARLHIAAAQGRRAGPSAGSRPAVPDPPARLIDAREQIERCRQARARLAALAAEVVQTEEAVAHIHDQMAARDSRHAAQYRRAADDARHAACFARAVQRTAAGSDLG
jgi:hypothetical protein